MRTRQPFAFMVQTALIGLLLFSFLLITQQWSRDVYRAGMLLLIGLTLLQIAFGNIPSTANFAQSMKFLLVAAVIIIGIVLLSVYLTPSLIDIGEGL